MSMPPTFHSPGRSSYPLYGQKSGNRCRSQNFGPVPKRYFKSLARLPCLQRGCNNAPHPVVRKNIGNRLEELSLLALDTEFTTEGHELRGFVVLVSQGEARQAEVQQRVQGITRKPLKKGSGDVAAFPWATKSQSGLPAVILEEWRFLGMSLKGGDPAILSSVSLFSRISGVAGKLDSPNVSPGLGQELLYDVPVGVSVCLTEAKNF